ncbi:hypothetical protein [Actinosynnema sp. NPDC023587]|uniref:hypothetical protein n=1 Tax=Actinosynnema sp. NPDC023587 TaxID=3154695 RepID=UPI0033BFFFE8
MRLDDLVTLLPEDGVTPPEGWRGGHPVEGAYRLVAAAEQTLADVLTTGRDGCDGEVLRAVREAAVTLAGHVLDLAGGQRAVDSRCARDVVAAREAMCRARDLVHRRRAGTARVVGEDSWFSGAEELVKSPECLTSTPTDLLGYATAATTAATTTAAHLVIGLRGSGSYLAPLWTAAFRRHRHDTTYLTARPRRRYTEVSTLSAEDLGITPEERERVARRIGSANTDVPVLLIDDAVSSGGTLAPVLAWLRALGATPITVSLLRDIHLDRLSPAVHLDGVHVHVHGHGGVVTPPPTGGADPASLFGRLLDELPGLRGTTVHRAVPMPPGYWTRYAAAHSTLDPDSLHAVDHRPRKHRFVLDATRDGRPSRLVAKFVGLWPFDLEETRRWHRFDVLTPHCHGTAGGYLFYDWVDGQVADTGTGADGLEDDLVERLADYCATALRHDSGGLLAGAQVLRRIERAVRTLAAANWLDDDGAAALVSAARRQEQHVGRLVQLPRNQGAWHFVRTPERWFRLHADASHWERRLDVAEEIAAVGTELALPHEAIRAVCARYGDLGGDRTAWERVRWAVPQHLARVVAEFAEHDRAVARVPRRYRRAPGQEAARYRLRHDRLRDCLHDWVPRLLESPGREGDG